MRKTDRQKTKIKPHQLGAMDLKKEVWKEVRRNQVGEVGREKTKEVLSVLSWVCEMEIKSFSVE